MAVGFQSKMITRRNLAEQLRDYQLRSERDWSSLSFWSAVNRGDASTSSWWGIYLICIVVFATASTLYFKDIRLSLSLLGLGIVVLVCCQTVGGRIARRRQRKMILP